MASTPPPRKGSARAAGTRNISKGPATRGASRPSSKRTNGTAPKRAPSGARRAAAIPAPAPEAQSSNNRLATVAKAAAGALVGTAAVGVAARAAVKRSRRQPRVLGMPMPRGLKPPKVKPGNVDLKKVARQVSNVAERVERTSGDVHTVSGQAKRVTRSLS